MDDELKIDASGCWVRKNAQVIGETPLRSHSENYSRLVQSLDAKVNIDDDEHHEVLFVGQD